MHSSQLTRKDTSKWHCTASTQKHTDLAWVIQSQNGKNERLQQAATQQQTYSRQNINAVTISLSIKEMNMINING